MFVFRKIWRAMFSWNTLFNILPLPYYRRVARVQGPPLVYLNIFPAKNIVKEYWIQKKYYPKIQIRQFRNYGRIDSLWSHNSFKAKLFVKNYSVCGYFLLVYNILIKQSVRLLLDIIQSAEYRSLTVSFRAYFDIFCLTLFSV